MHPEHITHIVIATSFSHSTHPNSKETTYPAGGRGIREADCASGRGALFRRRPLRARRVRRRDCRGDHRDVLPIEPTRGSRRRMSTCDRHLQPRSFSQMSMVPNPKRRTEVIVQPRRRIMRARIGKAGFLTGTALPCGVAQQEARRRCLRASIESVGGLLNVTPQANRWFCSSQT